MINCLFLALQSYAAEAGPESAEQPMEEAGMSDEVLQKLQDKATLLTAERKKVLRLCDKHTYDLRMSSSAIFIHFSSTDSNSSRHCFEFSENIL